MDKTPTQAKAAPLIINISLVKDPVAVAMARMAMFKPIFSQSTPDSSLLLPSLKSSCLMLRIDSLGPGVNQKHLTQCREFLRLNTNPFILLAPTVYCCISGSDLLAEANSLAVALDNPEMDKVPVVIPVVSDDIAIKTICFLANSR